MTKKLSFLLGIGFLSVTTLVWAQSDQTTPQPELRSSQVAMQARAGWMKSMNENLATMKYDAVGKDAAALSAQTSTVAEKQSNPLAKELTMKVSTLAKAR